MQAEQYLFLGHVTLSIPGTRFFPLNTSMTLDKEGILNSRLLSLGPGKRGGGGVGTTSCLQVCPRCGGQS